ncbi:MAG: nucleoside phosphorylase [Bryobacter sp.]|nr:nucleoside phosphorylase [Bryobacter sp.]
MSASLPLLNHPLDQQSEFTADALMADVRRLRQLPAEALPEICFLEFDGDFTDWLVETGQAHRVEDWACFHTNMFALDLAGQRCGIIARTIGAPYAVLIAEQLHAAGVRVIFGITSAGRIAPDLALPGLVVANGAVRDEGTSFHYLPPAETVAAPAALAEAMAESLADFPRALRSGLVWTTDAPYRETAQQIQHWAARGVLAVEMQAAGLFAFAQAKQAQVGLLALVSNATDHDGEQFNTGGFAETLEIFARLAASAIPLTKP